MDELFDKDLRKKSGLILEIPIEFDAEKEEP
jgi:hypothetical protein